MSLLPRRLPAPRRAALVLAALLVPVTVLPALAGLVVCPGSEGTTTSWSAASDCPRRALQPQPVAPQFASDEAPTADACITLPGVDAMAATAAPLVPTTSASLGVLPADPVVPIFAAEQEPPSERGPPLAVHRALRSVVLRI